MPQQRTLEDRLSALERRLDERGTEREDPRRVTATESTDGSDRSREPDWADLVARVETLEADIAELEAGVQAIRGYVGHVEHVNDSVERRANAAIAAVERLESAPKTPPPIATANPGGEATEAASRQGERTVRRAEEPDPETSDTGILDRINALR